MGSSNIQPDFAAKTTRRGDKPRSGLLASAAHSARRDDPPGALFPFSRPRGKTIAQRRHETLRRFNRLRKTRSAAKAARMVGASIPTLWRWQKKFTGRGLAGLQPRHSKAGRRSPFAGIHFTAKAVRELELLHMEQNNLRTAWQNFARFSATCPPLVAAYVQRTGRAPEQLAGLGRVQPVPARVFTSIDGRRLFVKLPMRGTLTTRLAVPRNSKH